LKGDAAWKARHSALALPGSTTRLAANLSAYEVTGKIPLDLGEDILAPMASVKAGFIGAQQCIPKRRWNEHARVEDRDEGHAYGRLRRAASGV
jgi:hypothetical protein